MFARKGKRWKWNWCALFEVCLVYIRREGEGGLALALALAPNFCLIN
jgi:hypothetical protein